MVIFLVWCHWSTIAALLVFEMSRSIKKEFNIFFHHQPAQRERWDFFTQPWLCWAPCAQVFTSLLWPAKAQKWVLPLEATWCMYNRQPLWEGMFRVFNHRISCRSPSSSDVICQGLMNCWLCFSGGASLMYYRWTAGPGLLSVCLAYVESSLISL